MKARYLMANPDRQDKPDGPEISGRRAVLLWLGASLVGWLAVLFLLSSVL